MPRHNRSRICYSVTKTFTDPSDYHNEAYFMSRFPWAAPALLCRDEATLTLSVERLTMLWDMPRRDAASFLPDLEVLINRLFREAGVHHRDVHQGNVGVDENGAVRLIDWECATILPSAPHSYDEVGPILSGVPVPPIHRDCGPMWMGMGHPRSIKWLRKALP